MYLLLFFG